MTVRVALLQSLALAAAFAGVLVLTSTVPATTARSTRTIDPSLTIDPLMLGERVVAQPRGRRAAASDAGPTDIPATPSDSPSPAPSVKPFVDAPVARAVGATPRSCPATYFCYPRLGIAGAIVPYDDCSGATDVGLAIRQLTCIHEGIWLAGHAYTQFGGLTSFRVGDVVYVRGRQFEITGSTIQLSCQSVPPGVAPLSLQTSLEPACGRVLVVEGR